MTEVEGYFEEFHGLEHQRLCVLRDALLAAIPGSTLVFAYKMPTISYQGKSVIHFASFKKHLGVYPTPGILTDFVQNMAPFKTTKGGIQFPHDQDLPVDLIIRMALYNLQGIKEGRMAKAEKKQP